MPRGDGTGPMGMGPLTGRGRGYCTGSVRSGYAKAGSSMGVGRGFRRIFRIFGIGRHHQSPVCGAGRMRGY